MECSCRILIKELDDPLAPLRPTKSDVPLAELLGLTTRLLDLGEIRDRAFTNLIKEHNRQAIYGMVEGRRGIRSRGEWEKLLESASDDIGTGRFIVRCLGAERYLDAATVAVLVTFRQNLIAELGKLSTADLMAIDSAIIAYHNMIRLQRWIGDTALVVERQLFGQEPLNEIHGPSIGDRLAEQITRLSEGLIPLQERCQRMMARSLDPLRKAGG